MIAVTFGRPGAHHVSVEGVVHGPFLTEIELARAARKLGAYLDHPKAEFTVIPVPGAFHHYTMWRLP